MAVRIAFDEVDSTQSAALDRARAGAVDGTYVVSATQSSGAGRSGRTWASPRGGLYLSWIGRLPRAAPSLLPLAVGVELRRELVGGAGTETQLKWPNDLYVVVPGRPPQKLGGILVDEVHVGPNASRAIVGVGLNVTTPRSSLPPELQSTAAILAELATPIPNVRATESWVVDAIERSVDRLETPGGPAAVVAECRQHLYGVGAPVSVDGRPVGILRDLADDGAAAVEQDGAVVTIHAGELTHPELA